MSAEIDRQGMAAFGLIVLGLGLAAAGGGGGEPARPVEAVPAMVARVDLRVGEQLEREMLELAEVPAGVGARRLIPPESVAAFTGRALVAEVRAGEPVLRADLAQREDGLADRVPAGRVAVAVPVDEVAGVAGRLAAGDRVRLVGVVPVDPPIAVEVLALGSPGELAGVYRVVVLSATPEQAQRIAALRAQGPVSLALESARGAAEGRP